MNLTLIGYGFVGKAVFNSLKDTHNIFVVDPAYNTNNIKDQEADGYIVCVPTPMRANGRCEMQHVFEVIDQIPKNVPVLIKSTICLEGWEALCDAYPDTLMSFSPEFLVAATADEDFAKQKYMLIGGESTQFWVDTFSKRFPDMLFYKESVTDLILIKYARNSFLATKVAFFNELYDVVVNGGGNWERVRKGVGLDERIGLSHTMVPGPDGKRGFGGACFPKDTNAFTQTAEYYNSDMPILKAVIEQNRKIRK
jgi:UDPglucose 6-dehydrogenase